MVKSTGYCRQVAGFSKSYASRLINATRVVTELAGELPIGNFVAPVSESQVRPLQRLSDPAQKALAWTTAVERAEGGQPTGAEVSEVVFEILNPEGAGGKPHSRAARRVELMGRLKQVIARRKSWEKVEELLKELEVLL